MLLKLAIFEDKIDVDKVVHLKKDIYPVYDVSYRTTSWYNSYRKEVMKMNQIKIGSFLKELRNEKNLTQEQIAEKFGVSQRSVSRWENGNTMPDISVLIELSDYYDVDLREILNGERKAKNMNEDLKETLVMVSDYTNEDKKKLVTSLYSMIWTCIVAFGMLELITVFHLTGDGSNWNTTAIFLSSVGLIYSISCFFKIRKLSGRKFR